MIVKQSGKKFKDTLAGECEVGSENTSREVMPSETD